MKFSIYMKRIIQGTPALIAPHTFISCKIPEQNTDTDKEAEALADHWGMDLTFK